jgi:hypothetical protein
VKEPKRVKKALETVEEMTVLLEYYMGTDRPEFRKLLLEGIDPLVKLIKELSIDQKKENARLAKILKEAWDKRIDDEVSKKLAEKE